MFAFIRYRAYFSQEILLAGHLNEIGDMWAITQTDLMAFDLVIYDSGRGSIRRHDKIQKRPEFTRASVANSTSVFAIGALLRVDGLQSFDVQKFSLPWKNTCNCCIL